MEAKERAGYKLLSPLSSLPSFSSSVVGVALSMILGEDELLAIAFELLEVLADATDVGEGGKMLLEALILLLSVTVLLVPYVSTWNGLKAPKTRKSQRRKRWGDGGKVSLTSW